MAITATSVRHPAPWNRKALAAAADRLVELLGAEAPLRVLDPYAGIGRVHELRERGFVTFGGEIEPEWCAASEHTIVADALRFPAEDGSFDAVLTSPCVGVDERVLTADLRWVKAGTVQTGDRLLTFDETSPFIKANGHRARRKYRIATVTGSGVAPKQCVQVMLANGDGVVCSDDHPWLTSRYSYGGRAMDWVRADRLMGGSGTGVGRGHRAGKRQPFHVLREMVPWDPERTYEAGWLAGMFDGEGSLSLGTHGAPKLVLTQNEGVILDRAEALLTERGKVFRYRKAPDRTCFSLFVGGGMEGILSTLGRLRPERLIQKFASLDVSTRSIEPEPVAVVAVEPVGVQDVATITTTSGTYITEGYLHHNTWANRMADHHDAQERCRACDGAGAVSAVAGHCFDIDGGLWHEPGQCTAPECRPRACCKACEKCEGRGVRDYVRNTYRHALGRMPSRGASSTMQFGSDYMRHHRDWLVEAMRLVRPEGVIVVNVSNHVRAGEEVDVIGWWLMAMYGEGLMIRAVDKIPAAKLRHGANRDLRVDGEVNIAAQVRP